VIFILCLWYHSPPIFRQENTMHLGIIGLPQSGKTTIFNSLTRGDQPTTMGGGRFEVHTAVVDVPDPRVDRLSELFNPEKTTYAKVTYEDIAGLDGSAGEKGISGQLLTTLQQADGFLLVLRCFDDPNVAHPDGSVDPVRDLDTMAAEFLINDLIMVERKLERLADETRKGGGRNRDEIAREVVLFERLQEALGADTPLREMDMDALEEKILSGFGFLTRKPLLVVQNLEEGQELPTKTAFITVPLQGRLEMDIAQLTSDEAEMFMEEYGLEETGLTLMIQHSYDLLGLQSFFTVGEDEVRAWTLRRGATAPEAAGEIHSDLQKGFIRAEVVTFEDMDQLGTMAAARSEGKLRVEGKSYVVQDGDIVHVRFNI
jgi:hypothetical protein